MIKGGGGKGPRNIKELAAYGVQLPLFERKGLWIKRKIRKGGKTRGRPLGGRRPNARSEKDKEEEDSPGRKEG